MSLPLFAVMVIYNRTVEESESFATLRRCSGVQTWVCDNSTKPMGNAPACVKYGIRYLSMDGNHGLPCAYNRTVEQIVKEQGEDGFVCLFDDDTEFTPDYFTALQREIEASPDTDIFLPLVYDKEGLMSPCTSKGVRMHRVKDPYGVPKENLYGINSGMAVRLSLLAKVKYNEDYFLDYVDFEFLRRAKAQGANLSVWNLELHQHFSAVEETDPEKVKIRDAIFQKDFRRFCDHGLWNRLRGEANLLYRRLFRNRKH